MYRRTEEHMSRLPFVRISRIELFDIKDVRHGVIELNCLKEDIPYNTKSDILGLYGQNGSGKSALVESLKLLKGIVGGYKIGSKFEKLINISSDTAKIIIEFEFQYLDGTKAKVEYGLLLKREKNTAKEIVVSHDEYEYEEYDYCLGITNEIIRTTLYDNGEIGRMHTIVDTEKYLFCGKTIEKSFFEDKDGAIKNELAYLKRKAYEESKSFLFSKAVADLLFEKGSRSRYYEIIAELNYYIDAFLFIISTRSSGLVQLRAGIPIFIPHMDSPLILADRVPIPAELFDNVEEYFEGINTVLQTVIPALKLKLEKTYTTLKNGEKGVYVKILSIRHDREFPFEYESDGIIKIVSVLADYIYAFNQGSTTLVIDEFDSGVFEYLLGELLEIFESDGKGQFIFTSHNLRPLEIIDKKFIRFTTSNPDQRYYKLRNISNSNNLRDVYLREVQLKTQDVEMYQKTKAFKIIKALKLVGEELR